MNKEGENKNKNLPALLPSFTLTDEQSNIVIYSIKNIEKEIFCEGVTVINGWVSMTDLRVKKKFASKLKLVKPIGLCRGTALKNLGVYLSEVSYGAGGKEFVIEGFDNLASRTLPQKNIDNIDSFNQEQQKSLPLWARTSREQALEAANKKVEEYNEKTLKSNAMKFSYIVRSLLEKHLATLYFQTPGWRRKFFLKENEWTDERRKQPDIQEKIDELIKDVEIVFRNVEFEGDLHYDAALGEKLYNRYGREIDSHNVYLEEI